MPSRPLPALVPSLATIVLAAAGCDMGPVEPSRLEAPSVLALQAQPASLAAPGEVQRVEALAYDADSVTWRACPTAWTPTTDPQCPSGELALGEGASVEFTVPEGLDALWVRADVSGAEPAIRELRATAAARSNPTVVSVAGPDGAAPSSVSRGATVRLIPEIDAAGEVLTSYFTEVGRFDPWRTYQGAPSTLEVPADAPAGPFRVWVVARDGFGGVGWTELELTVEDGP